MSATGSVWPGPRASLPIACCRAKRCRRPGSGATRAAAWRRRSSAAPTTWLLPSATAARRNRDRSSALRKQLVDLGAEHLVGDRAHVLAADAAVARDEEG